MTTDADNSPRMPGLDRDEVELQLDRFGAASYLLVGVVLGGGAAMIHPLLLVVAIAFAVVVSLWAFAGMGPEARDALLDDTDQTKQSGDPKVGVSDG